MKLITVAWEPHHAARLAAAAERQHTKPAKTDQRRNGGDVRQFEGRVEAVDVLGERQLDGAQLLPHRNHLGAEVLDCLFLVRCQDDFGPVRLLLDVLQFPLQFGQLGVERLLTRPVLLIGIAPDLLDQLKGPAFNTTPAQANQCFASGQVVESIQNEVGIVGFGNGNLLSEKLLVLDPETVMQEIGVGKDDDVDIAVLDRRRRLLGFGGLGFSAGSSSPSSVAGVSGSSAFGAPSG